MCVYSAFVSEAMKQWPGIDPGFDPNFYKRTYPWRPESFPPPAPSEDVLREIREIGKRLDALDKKLGAKDCTQEEAAKRAFEKRLDDFIQQAQDLKKSMECDNDGCGSDTSQQAIAGSGRTPAYVSGYGQVSSSPGIGLGNGSATLSKGV